jgi:hypothetical protein
MVGVVACVPLYKLFDSAYEIGGFDLPAPAGTLSFDKENTSSSSVWQHKHGGQWPSCWRRASRRCRRTRCGACSAALSLVRALFDVLFIRMRLMFCFFLNKKELLFRLCGI